MGRERGKERRKKGRKDTRNSCHHFVSLIEDERNVEKV